MIMANENHTVNVQIFNKILKSFLQFHKISMTTKVRNLQQGICATNLRFWYHEPPLHKAYTLS